MLAAVTEVQYLGLVRAWCRAGTKHWPDASCTSRWPLCRLSIVCCRAQGDTFQAEIMRQLREKQDRAKRKRDMLSRCRCACLLLDTACEAAAGCSRCGQAL